MRDNYAKYGDVMFIDATYQTNKYKLPLLVMSGINSNGENVIFGMGLLSKEDAASYDWVID